MSFDDKLYQSPAAKGDLAGLAIDLSLALSEIADALERLKQGDATSLDGAIGEIRKAESSILKQFDELTGWRKDER